MVVEVTNGAVNDGDLGVELLHLRASALVGLGQHAGAFEVFKAALAKAAGDPELLKVAGYDRAIAYQMAGQVAKSRADLERIYAMDSAYRDVAERLSL